jgi:hypothetical protein
LRWRSLLTCRPIKFSFFISNRARFSCVSVPVARETHKMQLTFLPQIRRAGCDEIFTTFAPALAAVFRSVCSTANSSSASAEIAQLYGRYFSSAHTMVRA